MSHRLSHLTCWAAVAGLAVCIFCFWAGFRPSLAEEKIIKIGTLFPLTGPVQPPANGARQQFRLLLRLLITNILNLRFLLPIRKACLMVTKLFLSMRIVRVSRT